MLAHLCLTKQEPYSMKIVSSPVVQKSAVAHITSALLALNFVAIPLASAQSSTPSSPGTTSTTSTVPAATLGEVTVTGNPLGAADLIAPATVLTGTELLLRKKSSLGETLDGLPGVSSTYFGPNASRPIIRGQDGDRIRVLSNGGASVDASGLSFDHAVPIDPLVIERVEVLRGPGALQYGGSAVGGVVNVINHRIHETPLFDDKGGLTGRAELRGGGADSERAASALLETGTDKFTVHVDAFDRKTSDVRVPTSLACDPKATGTPGFAQRLCNSSSQSNGGAVGGTAFFDRGYLGASVETFKTNYGSVAEDTVNIGMKQNRYALQGELRGFQGLFQSVKGQWSAVNYQHTEYESGVAGTTFNNAGNDFRLEARQTKAGRLDGLVGLQVEGNRFSATGVEAFAPYTRTGSKAVFAYEELGTDWGKVSLGARLESVRVESLGSPGIARFFTDSRSFNPGSYALGGLWNLGGAQDGEKGSGWTATSNLSYTQRAPKDYELYANGPHLATAAYERGNANLDLERSVNVDVGLAWKTGPNHAGLNVFANQFNNYISLESTGNTVDNLPEYAYRQVKARFTGLETTGKVRLLGAQGLAMASSTLDLALKGDLVRATNVSTGQALPRIAPARAGATLIWGQGTGAQGWGAQVGVDVFSAQNRVPTGDRTTGGYTFVNASATYAMKAGASNLLWFARLDNASNQLAYSASSVLTQTAPNRVPLPGRGLKVGVQATF